MCQALPKDARIRLHALLRVCPGPEVVKATLSFDVTCQGPTFVADTGKTRTCCVCEKAGPSSFLRALDTRNLAAGGEESLRAYEEAPPQGCTQSRREETVRVSMRVSTSARDPTPLLSRSGEAPTKWDKVCNSHRTKLSRYVVPSCLCCPCSV